MPFSNAIVCTELQKPEAGPTKHEIEVQLGTPTQLTCNIIGYPLPAIEWYKNGKLVVNGTKLRLSSDMKAIHINETVLDDTGEFKCVGKNRFGSVETIIKLKFTGMTN